MTLFRYVIREYFRYVFGTVALCVFLFVLFDFMHKTSREFAEYQPSGPAIAKFYFYQIPFQIIQALPIASLIASVVSMALLSRGNEVTVMRAVGMGPLRIGFPLVAGGSLLTVAAFLGGELIVPASSQKMHYVQDVLIKGESDSALGKGEQWVRDKSRFVNFSDFDQEAGTLGRVTITEIDDNFGPEKVTQAKEAIYSRTQGNWNLQDVEISEFGRDRTLIAHRMVNSVLAFLPIDPSKLKRERRRPDEMSAGELTDLIRTGKESGKDVLTERIALSTKWAYPFAAVLVSLMGLRFGYRSERTNETMKNLILAFLTGLSYWFILSAARALGTRGDISPGIAAWTANVVMLSIVSVQLWTIKKA
jgi:lipopolysaccharide export system permease protein